MHDPKPISPKPLDESRRKELDECIKLHNIAAEDSVWLCSLVAGGTGLPEYVAPPFCRPTLPPGPQSHTPATVPLLPPQPHLQPPKKTCIKHTHTKKTNRNLTRNFVTHLTRTATTERYLHFFHT